MIEIVRFGSQATVVDKGRYLYRRYGVPLSGAMDRISAARANSLLSNTPEAALLELYQPGHELIFHTDTYFCVTGAEAEIHLDEKRIYIDQVCFAKKSSRLLIGQMTRGCRTYLAVKDGILTQQILGSKSPIPGFLNRHLYKGDIIPIAGNAKTACCVFFGCGPCHRYWQIIELYKGTGMALPIQRSAIGSVGPGVSD